MPQVPQALPSLQHAGRSPLAVAIRSVSRHLATHVARARVRDRLLRWSTVNKDARLPAATPRVGTSRSAGPVPCRSSCSLFVVSLLASNSLIVEPAATVQPGIFD